MTHYVCKFGTYKSLEWNGRVRIVTVAVGKLHQFDATATAWRLPLDAATGKRARRRAAMRTLIATGDKLEAAETEAVVSSTDVWFATLGAAPAAARPSRLVSPVRGLGGDVEFGSDRRPGDSAIAGISHGQGIGRRGAGAGRALGDPCHREHPLLFEDAEQPVVRIIGVAAHQRCDGLLGGQVFKAEPVQQAVCPLEARRTQRRFGNHVGVSVKFCVTQLHVNQRPMPFRTGCSPTHLTEPVNSRIHSQVFLDGCYFSGFTRGLP